MKFPFFARASVAAVGLVASAGCRLHSEASAQTPARDPAQVILAPDKMASAKVVVEAVEVRTVDDTLTTSARITLDDMRVAHIYSPVGGRVTRIFAKQGERVKKGQPLCMIESSDVGQAASDLHKAQADVIAAEHDFNRLRKLEKEHAAATKDAEAAEDRVRQAKAEVERAAQKARLFGAGSIDRVTSSFALSSAIDGEVLMRAVNPGVEVQGQYTGGTAVELFTVGEIDRVWAMADIYEVDIPHVRQDARASVRVVAYKDREFSGRVEWIQHVLDPQTRTVKARFSFDNPDLALLPEMYGTMTIKVDERKALALPRSAIARLGDQRVVFVEVGRLADGQVRFERTPVEVDDRGEGNWLPVKHGVEGGMRVATSGVAALLEL